MIVLVFVVCPLMSGWVALMPFAWLIVGLTCIAIVPFSVGVVCVALVPLCVGRCILAVRCPSVTVCANRPLPNVLMFRLLVAVGAILSCFVGQSSLCGASVPFV